MHALEKSDCGVLPVNQPNTEGKPSAEVGEGRAWAVENIVQSHMLPTQSGNCMSQGMGGVRQATLPPLIHGKSRMRRRARTDLCEGRSEMIVPTATIAPAAIFVRSKSFVTVSFRARCHEALVLKLQFRHRQDIRISCDPHVERGQQEDVDREGSD
jgi:hypothetical protein